MDQYITLKCSICKQDMLLRKDLIDTLHEKFCGICFFEYVVEDIYGNVRLKTDEERDYRDLTYKDELIEVTHRGKTKITYE